MVEAIVAVNVKGDSTASEDEEEDEDVIGQNEIVVSGVNGVNGVNAAKGVQSRRRE